MQTMRGTINGSAALWRDAPPTAGMGGEPPSPSVVNVRQLIAVRCPKSACRHTAQPLPSRLCPFLPIATHKQTVSSPPFSSHGSWLNGRQLSGSLRVLSNVCDWGESGKAGSGGTLRIAAMAGFGVPLGLGLCRIWGGFQSGSFQVGI
jgi:hypothetical protein